MIRQVLKCVAVVKMVAAVGMFVADWGIPVSLFFLTAGVGLLFMTECVTIYWLKEAK